MLPIRRRKIRFCLVLGITLYGACDGDAPTASLDAMTDTGHLDAFRDAKHLDAHGEQSSPVDLSRLDGDGPRLATRQRVVVIADDATATRATMVAFEGIPGAWSEIFRHPVVIGRKGLAWGRGVHDPGIIPKGAILKREGDGKSPMGLFALTQSWGYLAPTEVMTKLPYATATDTLICVDDVTSTYYNQVIDWEDEGLKPGELPSHEAMLLSSVVYKYTIFVAHNVPSPKPGAGSCIFLHLWSGPQGTTAGCTAMAEASMLELLAWLDPAKTPLLAQLTRAEYARVKTAWALPEVPTP